MAVEQRPTVAGQQEKPWEPKTFAERKAFLGKVTRLYLNEKISWQDKWFYEQKYGPGSPGEITI